MTTGPDFRPVFGPNGAVLNAPTMTPEMRAKIERASRLPSQDEILRHLRSFFLFVLVWVMLTTFAKPLREFLAGSPWWAGAATGAFAVVMLGLVFRVCRDAFTRWELLQHQSRILRLPIWARMMLAASDIGVGIGIMGMAFNFATDFNSERGAMTAAFAAVFIISAILGAIMRWLGDETRWEWRTARLASLSPPRQHHEGAGEQHADDAR